LWAMIVDWDKAGRPKPSRSSSSFPDWADVVGGIVEHAGFGCPLQTPQSKVSVDTDGEDMRLLAAEMAKNDGSGGTKFADLVEVCRKCELFEHIIPTEGKLGGKERSTLGRLLQRYSGRQVGEHRFVMEGSGHSKKYRVEPVAVGEAAASEAPAEAEPEPEPQPAARGEETEI
jgi:hypothetical protein